MRRVRWHYGAAHPIIKDIERFSSMPPKLIREGTHHFPAISKLHKHGHNSDLEFEIMECFPDQGSFRHVYYAETSESEGGTSTKTSSFRLSALGVPFVVVSLGVEAGALKELVACGVFLVDILAE